MTESNFEWCDVRWDGPGTRDHVCAQHTPGHVTHVCCCGAVREHGETA